MELICSAKKSSFVPDIVFFDNVGIINGAISLFSTEDLRQISTIWTQTPVLTFFYRTNSCGFLIKSIFVDHIARTIHSCTSYCCY